VRGKRYRKKEQSLQRRMDQTRDGREGPAFQDGPHLEKAGSGQDRKGFYAKTMRWRTIGLVT